MKSLNFLYIAFFFALVSFSCQKDDQSAEADPNKKGSIVLEFDNVVGTNKLVLGSNQYQNAAGENFTVSMFKYYVSNIKLKTAKGTTYTVPQNESYFLINQEDAASQKVRLNNVPEGDYTELTFTIGVDSLRNTMDLNQRTGVLDPTAYGMYWSWNSGYIFLKMEGSSPQATEDGKYRFHIGGFGGYSSQTLNNVKTITLPFGTSQAKLREGATPEVHLLVDVLKMFEGKGDRVSIAKNSTVMFNEYSKNIANNYVDMFRVDHIHNEGDH